MTLFPPILQAPAFAWACAALAGGCLAAATLWAARRPLHGLADGFMAMPPLRRALAALAVAAAVAYAGTKPEATVGSSTNRHESARMEEKGEGAGGEWRDVVSSKEEGVSAEDSSSVVAAGEAQPDVAHHTSTLLPTPSSLTEVDFARGFVLARVGMGEEFDFAPPPGATVIDDWRAFGAVEDWTYVAFTNWELRVGTNGTIRLRIFSFGKVDSFVRDGEGNAAAGTWFAPFMASLGIVPQANWGRLCASARPSQVWYATTPEGSLSVTWQNALLGRDAERPVSFQAELFPDRRFVYRYDLSRRGEGGVPVTVGAALGGGAWTTNALPTNVTSMAFYPLTSEDRDNPDADGDGLPTADELILHGTDPHNADTDRDGLSDYEELFLFGTDPLNPRSVRDDFSDGIAVKLGGLDPFACPEGSTNTALEHVFYSGTTNGAFSFPRSSDKVAVLQVSASGSGTGDLIVGDKVVPLVGEGVSSKEQGVSAESSSSVVTASGTQQDVDHDTYSLLLAPCSLPHHSLLLTPSSLSLSLSLPVPRGVALPLYLRADGTLSVSLSSEDFAFGVLPTHASSGWINFPNTAATEPCIHDYAARKTRVWLSVGEGAEALSCTWRGDGNVEVENHPPRTATITGNFPARGTAPVTYTLSHPDYLFGQTSYGQTVRFCPKPPDPDPKESDPPWYDGGGSGGGGHGDMRWCCHWGTCGDGCDCGCDCAAAGGGESDPSGGDAFDEVCPEHSTPYVDCTPLHAADYTNVVQRVPRLGGVLYIREPPSCERIRLDMPTEYRNCCPCPDHWTNYVGVAYKSHRLRLVDADGRDFERTETSCDVLLSGVSPSAAVGDATLAFARNGEVYRQYAKTVLGVAIRGGPGVDLAACNALSRDFGYPMTVCTNEWNAPEMRLVTNVRLPDGNVHLELVNATGQFAVWHLDRRTGERRRLLDSATTPVKNLPMAYWKALMRRATDGGSAELPIWITSSAPGAATLVFRYWNVIDGRFVQDEVAQRITSLLPPLRLDVSRDGRIDDGDAAAWLDGRTFYYWTNEDTVKGDRIGQIGDRSPNANDLKVNGTFDLVNFFPVALDLSSFTESWQDRVTYTLRPEWDDANSFNFCLADVPWDRAGSIQTTGVTTLSGQALSSASLTSLPMTGYPLDYHETLTRLSANSGLVICEAKSRYAALRIDIKAGDTTLYSYSAPMTILPVREMYSWYNFRSLSGENVGRATEFHTLWEEDCSKALVFLHGANVSTEDAEQWGDVVFKRMWLSGAKARFYNVDWRSDIGSDANYHENASNAFAVAGQIVSAISGIPGEKTIMAHSLGNMVVSSMIHDHGLQVSKYLMCNSAVPAEAYDPSLSLRTGKLVHPDWEEYPTNSWTASWHALFKDDPNDDRRLLGWPGRFANVLDKAVNFYSSGENGGDEVLELAADNDVGILTGITSSLAHHSWHKQELFKGRGLGVGAGATDWSGWNIEENWLGIDKIPAERALKMSDADFRTNTVFYCHPSSMNSTNIPLLVRGAHLALGIPALVAAAGVTDLSTILDQENSFNLDLANPGIEHPNGWPSKSGYPNRWLHSDIKDVSYFFNFKFYEKATEKGGLK